jgi:S-adenosylmethionine:tRNA ribosyltransferase-isomerase
MIDTDSIDIYDYDLPAEYIAEYPLEKRDQSKLLVYKNNTITDSNFYLIDGFLPSNSLLIFNNSRVVQARFLFQTSTSATIELFSLEPADGQGSHSESLSTTGSVIWKCFVGNAKRWKQHILERTIQINTGENIYLNAEIISKKEDYFIIQFTWNPASLSFSEILILFGDLPLPPYMKRNTEESDKIRYQTVYSKEEGSVAAPTAGLHFTEELMSKLLTEGVRQNFVTLHVGAGTFKPVKTNSLSDHIMHSEYINVTRECIEQLLNKDTFSIIPVGTTSMRTLESIYWLGCKMHYQPYPTGSLPELLQWDAYTLKTLSVSDSIQTILNYMSASGLNSFSARTALLIKPGYSFKMCDALITNFHQPKSTLLCLVSSFIGIEPLKQLYNHALNQKYRFLSFGDSSLLFKKSF